MTLQQLNPTTIKIIASDLDGTLLAPDHRLSDYTKQILKALHQQGYIFVFATGRHHIDVAGIRQDLGIPAYMITSNGARVYTPENQVMYSQDYPSELVEPVIKLIENDPNLVTHIYQNDQWFLFPENDQLKNFRNQSGFHYQVFNIKNIPTQGVIKVFFTNKNYEQGYLDKFETRLRDNFDEQLNISFSSPWCLETMDNKVSKGNALQLVAQSLDYQLENCIAFGDGMNDIELLSMAGKGLVMGTAHSKVKETLPDAEVIGSHADNAVAHYLEKHLLKGQ